MLLCAALTFAACATAKNDPTAPVGGEVAKSQATGLSNAEILYGYRCKGCHEPATPGAPDRKELATYEEREIVAALSKGAMKHFAPGLSKQDVRELAAFLVSRAAESDR
jgi:cytochrome c5